MPYMFHYLPVPHHKFYSIFGFVARKQFGHMWIFKQYKDGFKIPNVDYPKNPYRFRLGGHPGRIVTRYYYPYNRKSEVQQAWRQVFRHALDNWESFNTATKNYYNELKQPKYCTNLDRYLHFYLKANYPPA